MSRRTDPRCWSFTGGNYHNDPSWATGGPFERHLKGWLTTPQPDQFLSSLAESLEDDSTIAEIWEDGDRPVAFLWVTFHEIESYSISYAEVRDLEVAPDFQRRGIGLRLLERAEKLARERGAVLLRSETGAGNTASRRLHEKHGFGEFRVQYEKLLTDSPKDT